MEVLASALVFALLSAAHVEQNVKSGKKGFDQNILGVIACKLIIICNFIDEPSHIFTLILNHFSDKLEMLLMSDGSVYSNSTSM